jgi:nitric oxide reductase NorD protein
MTMAADAEARSAPREVRQPSSPALARSVESLLAMVRQREALGEPFRIVWTAISGLAQDDLDQWAQAALELANVNVGVVALSTFFRITSDAVAHGGTLPQVALAAEAAADICRSAGAAATRACLEARLRLALRLRFANAGPETAWWRGLTRLAKEAPASVAVLAPLSERIVTEAGTQGFEAFVGAGLRLTAGKPQRQTAFFSLEDPEARLTLDRLAGQVTFAALRPRLRAYSAALWGKAFPLRETGLGAAGALPQRANIDGGLVRIPDVFKNISAAEAPALFEAVVAHATAHLALGAEPFEPGSLKPLQIALIGLIEDARIETLAMRRFPGLRQLWSRYHIAEPSPLKTPPFLMARMARALFDPEYVDADGFVAKARALFSAERDLNDPALSRRIGGLLGNDLGQMRLQFNAKTHVIEPIYRDDGLGLWRLPPPPDTPETEIEMTIASARMGTDGEQQQTPRETSDEKDKVGRARAVAADDIGMVVAKYPEWDRAAGIERPDWTIVREIAPRLGSVQALDEANAGDPGLRLRIERLVRNARIGRVTRLRRQPDGADLDLDATIDAATALRRGDLPDERVFERKVLRSRDFASLLLIDTSASTQDPVPAAASSILDVEKSAVAVLAEAMGAVGDRFALRAFASNGRDEVRFARIKDFDGKFDAAARARLAGLQSKLSTRLGAALRHAGAELDEIAATRRIVLALTDGAPSDIDVPDAKDLVEDARRAVLALRMRGIDAFGITLDPTGQGAGAIIFGRANHMPIRRIQELPWRLSELYFRLARR